MGKGISETEQLVRCQEAGCPQELTRDGGEGTEIFMLKEYRGPQGVGSTLSPHDHFIPRHLCSPDRQDPSFGETLPKQQSFNP